MQPIVAGVSMRSGGSAPEDSTDIAELIRNHVGERTYQHWFDGRTSFSVADEVLRIAVASPFLVTWMQKQLREPLALAASALLGPSGRFELFVDSAITPEPDTATNVVQVSTEPTTEAPVITRHRRFSTMDELVVGESNQLAAVAAREIAANPGQKYNPLFVHGPAGTGKTHLLEAIYCEVRKRFPDSQVLYLTAEAFINYFTQAQRERTMPSFRQRFRNVDVLLVDDIDFFDAKRGTQEELLHTMTQLQSHGRQVVVSADRHPRMLGNLRDELTTRFQAGLVCRLEAPDERVREEFVRRKAQQLGAEFTSDALAFVARRFRTNVREIEGALNSLDTHHAATQERISLTVARRVLGQLERDYQRIVSVTDIENTVGTMFGVSSREMRSASRQRRISQPRMLAMYLTRRHTHAAYQEIGRYFGNRNHSTVMSAERKVQGWIEHQAEIRVVSRVWRADELVETLEEKLAAG